MRKDDPWTEYARIQALADSPRLSNRTWADEEALDTILDKIESEQQISAQQADDLLINRARTQRKRHNLLAQHGHVLAVENNENDRVEARSVLAWHQGRCNDREWRVLVSVGLGHTYRRIASAENVAEATIKTWVRRARLKLAA